jgi:hypothetical protein
MRLPAPPTERQHPAAQPAGPSAGLGQGASLSCKRHGRSGATPQGAILSLRSAPRCSAPARASLHALGLGDDVGVARLGHRHPARHLWGQAGGGRAEPRVSDWPGQQPHGRSSAPRAARAHGGPPPPAGRPGAERPPPARTCACPSAGQPSTQPAPAGPAPVAGLPPIHLQHRPGRGRPPQRPLHALAGTALSAQRRALSAQPRPCLQRSAPGGINLPAPGQPSPGQPSPAQPGPAQPRPGQRPSPGS